MTIAENAPEGYPVRVDVPYQEEYARWLPLIKWLLVIPHLIILYFLNIAWQVITFLAIFIILFTEKYPEGLFNFSVGFRRWQLNAYSYALLLRDEYPPFSWDPGQYPAVLEVDYPEKLNRFLPLIKWLLIIPHLIVLTVLAVVMVVLVIIALFAILFTRKFPRGMFDFVVGWLRWNERATAYFALFTDKYPPFSLK